MHYVPEEVVDRQYLIRLENSDIILGEDAYGNKDVSEFLAEAVSEYFSLNEHQQYMVEMYTEIKRLYSKSF